MISHGSRIVKRERQIVHINLKFDLRAPVIRSFIPRAEIIPPFKSGLAISHASHASVCIVSVSMREGSSQVKGMTGWTNLHCIIEANGERRGKGRANRCETEIIQRDRIIGRLRDEECSE